MDVNETKAMGGKAAKAEAAPATPAPETTVTLSKSELETMLQETANRAAAAAVAAMPAPGRDTVVMMGEKKRDVEKATEEINKQFSDRVEVAKAKLNDGHYRFSVSSKANPRGTMTVCAGSAGNSEKEAGLLAVAKYNEYFGIHSYLESDKVPSAECLGLASEAPADEKAAA
jgi:hypothetical protein